MNRTQAQVFAFGAVCEAATATDLIALGELEHTPTHLLGSIYATAEEDLESLFQPREPYLRALDHAADLLRGEITTAHRARYTVQVIKLAGALSKSRNVTAQLRQLLDATPSHQQDTHRAAEIYSETLSTLKPTVVVHGTSPRLQRPSVADAIRASLLAGVRFAWLWQQLGGRQWHLVLKRGQVLRTINELRMH